MYLKHFCFIVHKNLMFAFVVPLLMDVDNHKSGIIIQFSYVYIYTLNIVILRAFLQNFFLLPSNFMSSWSGVQRMFAVLHANVFISQHSWLCEFARRLHTGLQVPRRNGTTRIQMYSTWRLPSINYRQTVF